MIIGLKTYKFRSGQRVYIYGGNIYSNRFKLGLMLALIIANKIYKIIK